MSDRYQKLLADYAVAPHAMLDATKHEVKRRVIDTLGVMFAAFNDDAPRAARAYAKAFALESGSTIFGGTQRSTPEIAAFVNGVHARYLDYNDTYLSLEPLHPSDVIMPLLALAEWANCTGAQLIEAVAVAYEIGMNLCDAASLRSHGWDHVNYIGLGTAAGAARLLSLNATQAAHALSLALVPHASMRQTRSGELSMWKGSAAANSSRNGLFGALLAQQGFTGPSLPFTGEMGIIKQLLVGEGFHDEALQGMASLQAPQRICDSYIKAYPVEYHAQSAVDAARALHAQIGDWQQIDQIEVETFSASYQIIVNDPEKWKPTTRETADHSLQYIIAATLLEGKIAPASFDYAHLQDERIRGLLACTTVINSAELTALYPESIPVTISVRLKNGSVECREARYPRGHVGNKMTDAEVVEKFTGNAASLLNEQRRNSLLETVWGLESLSSLRALTAQWGV